MSLNHNELTRYSRQIQLKNFGIDAQLQLKNARVLCIGAGGLGSVVLLYLTTSGIGTIGMIDNDTVALSNLQRQIIYNENNIGKKKVSAATANLKLINSNINFIEYDTFLTESNVLELIKDFDLIIDCTDNFSARYLVNDACFALKKPLISGAIQDYEGQVQFIIPDKTPCYRCTYLAPPPVDLAPSCADNGVLSVLPGTIGLIQATEAIKYLSKTMPPSLAGKLLIYNALDMTLNKLTLKPNPLCPCCSLHKKFHEISRATHQCNDSAFISETEINPLVMQHNALLIDVRSPDEHRNYNIGGINIPVTELETRIKELPRDAMIIIYCQKGVRSQTAYELLKNHGITRVKVLKGGLDFKKNS